MSVAWRQGKVARGTKDMWYVITADADGKLSYDKIVGNLPENITPVKGGVKSAYRSIQVWRGNKPLEPLSIDLGIMDIVIDKPEKTPGKMGAIRYKLDAEQKTKSDITIGKEPSPEYKSSIKGIRGTSVESLSKLPLATTLEQLLTIEYKSVPLRQFAKQHSLPVKLREAGVGEVARLLQQLVARGKLEAKASILAKRPAGKGTSVPKTRKLGDSYEDTLAVVRSMLPDRDAARLSKLLTSAETATLAPVRGYPKPTKTTGRLVIVKAKQRGKEEKLRPTQKSEMSLMISRLAGE